MTRDELRMELINRTMGDHGDYRREKFGFVVDRRKHYDKGEYIELTIGCMYEAPKVNLDVLIWLSQVFGTTDIDVDQYAQKGCESCDFGSDYGHTIQIYHATLNTDI